jgi:holo-[acyl-carrier protein] synthase
MIILGLGTDIVSVQRIAALVEDRGQRFLDRVFRPDELLVMKRTRSAAAAALAARWAAKEACIKALGGFSRTIPYRDVELVRAESGQPRLRLHGGACEALAAMGASTALVSLSHEHDHAMATVILF